MKSKINEFLNFSLSFWILIFGFCILFSGCQSLQKKFIRKPKDEPKAEEPLLMPQAYNIADNKETLYKNYFVYWRSFQDELIAALEANLSAKKQASCADFAVTNLEKLREFLNEEKQAVLDPYLAELKSLRGKIKESDLAGAKLGIVKHKLSVNRRNIIHNFMYSKVKDDLK